MSSIISVRVNDTEEKILNSVSAMYGCGVSSFIKKVVFEKIEDDYDIKSIEEYESEKKNGTLETRPIEELWEELDL